MAGSACAASPQLRPAGLLIGEPVAVKGGFIAVLLNCFLDGYPRRWQQ